MEARNKVYVEEYIDKQDPEGFFKDYAWVDDVDKEELRMVRLAFKLFSFEELAGVRDTIVDELARIDYDPWAIVMIFVMLFSPFHPANRWSLEWYFQVLLEKHLVPEIEELFAICAPSATDDELTNFIDVYCELYKNHEERHKLFDQFVMRHWLQHSK